MTTTGPTLKALPKYIPAVMKLLFEVAKARSTISYSRLYALFPENTPSPDVMFTLEAACEELSPYPVAIYSVVLTTRTGLPGIGFFDVFRIHQRAEYLAIAGDVPLGALTEPQKARMAAQEKARVYGHAAL